IRWAVAKLQETPGRKAVIIFTDGRDGRLTPQWLRNGESQEVFDPLFGLPDTGEAEEFVKVLDVAHASAVRFFFLAFNTDQPPSFRGRPVSGLYPGAKEAITDYVSRARSRMNRMAEATDGELLYGDGAQEAIQAYQNLHRILELDSRYTIEYTSDRSRDEGPRALKIQLRNPDLEAVYRRSR